MPSHNSYDACPKCGGLKDTRSKGCMNCKRIKPEQRICPTCGGKKDFRSIQCVKCRVVKTFRHGTHTGWYDKHHNINMIYHNGKYKPIYRALMEDYLNCALPTDWFVHHVDGDRQNNDLDNLMVVTNTEHSNLHRDPVSGQFKKTGDL